MTTIIEGLPHIFDEKKIVKAWKKTLNCIGTINKDKEGQMVITLSGD
jgi:translation initiation factor 1 (eIF-1/SUI1)